MAGYTDVVFRALCTSFGCDLTFTEMISAKGLTCKEDNIHFNSASYREFGRRYFEAYRAITKK